MRAQLSKTIDAEFENSDNPTKTETEQAFLAGFVAMAGNLALLLNGIGLAVAFTILLVTANTMSIAVRERQAGDRRAQDAGVLQRAGDELILSEALLIGAMGGLLGLLLSKWLLGVLPDVPLLGDIVAHLSQLRAVAADHGAGHWHCPAAGAGWRGSSRP